MEVVHGQRTEVGVRWDWRLETEGVGVMSSGSVVVAMRACAPLFVVLLWAVCFASPAGAVTVPSGFSEKTVFTGLSQPTAVRFASDGRVFVAEKNGLIKEFEGLTDTTPRVYADLRTNVHDYWDRGLLSIALDPNFPMKNVIYALYAHDAPIGGTAPVYNDFCGDPTGAGCQVSGRLSRILPDGSEQVIIEDWCQQYPAIPPALWPSARTASCTSAAETARASTGWTLGRAAA